MIYKQANCSSSCEAEEAAEAHLFFLPPDGFLLFSDLPLFLQYQARRSYKMFLTSEPASKQACLTSKPMQTRSDNTGELDSSFQQVAVLREHNGALQSSL